MTVYIPSHPPTPDPASIIEISPPLHVIDFEPSNLSITNPCTTCHPLHELIYEDTNKPMVSKTALKANIPHILASNSTSQMTYKMHKRTRS